MPVPKSKQKLYGKIAGRMQNQGKDLEEAKEIADRAIKDKPRKKQSNRDKVAKNREGSK